MDMQSGLGRHLVNVILGQSACVEKGRAGSGSSLSCVPHLKKWKVVGLCLEQNSAKIIAREEKSHRRTLAKIGHRLCVCTPVVFTRFPSSGHRRFVSMYKQSSDSRDNALESQAPCTQCGTQYVYANVQHPRRPAAETKGEKIGAFTNRPERPRKEKEEMKQKTQKEGLADGFSCTTLATGETASARTTQ